MQYCYVTSVRASIKIVERADIRLPFSLKQRPTKTPSCRGERLLLFFCLPEVVIFAIPESVRDKRRSITVSSLT